MEMRLSSWTELKSLALQKKATIRYTSTPVAYNVYIIDGVSVFVHSILRTEPNEALNDFVSNFKPQCDAQKEIREARTSDGRLRTASEKPDCKKTTIITHDWTDPTTWYTQSQYHEHTTVVESTEAGPYIQLPHTNIIDTAHGKISQEDFLQDAEGKSYRVKIKIGANDFLDEVDPHTDAGDFEVDYATGKITLAAWVGETVTVCYHYAAGSTFYIRPEPGKALKIEIAEVQFSDDVILNDAVLFEAFALASVVAPELGLPPGTKVPISQPVVYKAMSDYQNDAVRSYPAYPALGGPGWRGSPKPIIIFDWDYRSSTVLRSDAGMEIRMRLQHDTAFGGYYATATFYCTSESL